MTHNRTIASRTWLRRLAGATERAFRELNMIQFDAPWRRTSRC
jgi:hypothetical protein